jgi:hypothetical protein
MPRLDDLKWRAGLRVDAGTAAGRVFVLAGRVDRLAVGLGCFFVPAVTLSSLFMIFLERWADTAAAMRVVALFCTAGVVETL